MPGHSVAVGLLLSLVILETSILIHYHLTTVDPRLDHDTTQISTETWRLFASFDTNGDGVIDPWEFEAVKQRVTEISPTEAPDFLSDNEIEDKFEELKNTTGEILDLKTEFIPLALDSMTKLRDEQASQDDLQCLEGLKQWQNVLKHEAAFPVEAFKLFLPKRKNVDIGEPWMIVTPSLSRYGPGLSSNRYTPPAVLGNQDVLHYLLLMFHPRPFLYTRFPPQGAVACIRAENKNFLEIEFRIHAEYQLNKPPLLPFWFTPAQFSGRLVIKRDGSHVQTFEMEVPNNQTLNVDMEWLTGKKSIVQTAGDRNDVDGPQDENEMNMEVDIGYLPKMKIHSIDRSYLPNQKDKPAEKQDIVWEEEISREEATSILEKKMYPFKKVPYLAFDKAYTKAKEEKKLVHSILLWGALDDQSC